MKRPIVLITAGLEGTAKGIPQLHLYQNYAEAMTRSGCMPVVICTNQKDQLRQLAEMADGLFLTGGEDISPEQYGQTDEGLCGPIDSWRDAVDLYLCERFVQQKKPILGICRGMQVINTYFCGTIIQDLNAERGLAHPYHTTHEVTSADGSWIRKTFGKSFIVNSYHHQAVDILGSDLIPTAFSENGQIVEGIEHCTLPIQGVQWHPERMIGPLRYDLPGPSMEPYFTSFYHQCLEEGKNE